MSKRLLFLIPACCALVSTGCANQNTTPQRASSTYDVTQLVKTDTDRVTEVHQREIFADLKILTEKLYRRNPRELKKSGQPNIAAGIARIFDNNHNWQFSELQNKRDIDALMLAFRDDYQGDRVLALVVGLGSMVQTSLNDKTEFFFLDDLEPQGLYNAARNVEIAVWKLSNARRRSR